MTLACDKCLLPTADCHFTTLGCNEIALLTATFLCMALQALGPGFGVYMEHVVPLAKESIEQDDGLLGDDDEEEDKEAEAQGDAQGELLLLNKF
jgi:hypothetical protein